MDAYKMMNLLSYRLEDSGSNLFTDTFKIKALNNGITRLIQAIHPSYLTELQVIKTQLTLTAGVADLTAANLGYLPLRGGQGVLKVKDYTTGTYCLQIDLDYLKKIENTFLSASTGNPLFYIFQNKLYVLPTTITKVDVYFLKIPENIIYKFIGDVTTVTTTADTLTADASQELNETTNDFYNGMAIYSIYDSKYTIVTDYVAATRVFKVSPALTTGTDRYYYLIKNDFDAITLPKNIAPEINSCIHEIAVSLAESYCWAMDNNTGRSKIAFDQAIGEIELLNSRYTEAEGIGTSDKKR